MNLSKEHIEKELNSLEDKKTLIDRMNHYASQLFRIDDDWGDVLAGKALLLSRAAEYDRGIAQALLIKGLYSYKKGRYETMLEHITESEQIIRVIPDGNSLGLHRLLNCKALYYMDSGNYIKAIEVFEEAIKVCRDLGDPVILSNIYVNLSEIYNVLGQPRRALEYCIEVIHTLDKKEHPLVFIFSLNSAAHYLCALQEYREAAAYLDQAYGLVKQYNYADKESLILSSYSKLYLQTGEYEKAKINLKACLRLERKPPEVEVTSLMRLGSLHLTLQEYDRARQYLTEALNCSLKYKRFQEEKEIHLLLESLYIQLEDYKKAYYHLKQTFELQKMIYKKDINSRIKNLEDDSLRRVNRRIKTISTMGQKITSDLDMKKVLDNIYENINVLMDAELFGIITFNKEKKILESEFYIEKGKQTGPFYLLPGDLNNFISLVFRENRDIIIGDLANEYRAYLKEARGASEVLFTEDFRKKPHSLICSPLIIGSEVIGVITAGSYKQNAYTLSDLDSFKALASYVAIALKNASQSRLIKQQNRHLGRTNRKLEDVNRQIISSIGYAQKIQSSILPSTDILKSFFSSFFLIYQPRDIIGGDFYWFREDRQGLLCVVGDCTGHGIPGAFMSMAVTTLLTKLNDDNFYDNPALLLSHLNSYLKKTLKQEGKTTLSLSDDGADLGILFIPPCKSYLVFAGAGLSLYYVNDTKVHEIQGDKMSIGYRRSTTGFPYTNYKVTLQDRVSCYLATDGYWDQIGGRKTLPMGRKKFTSLLLAMEKRSMEEQKAFLEKEFRLYRGKEKQIDDVTLLGFTL